MTLAGFLAQFVDGSMGLGYGTISTTFLLAYGVSPAIVSSRVHSRVSSPAAYPVTAITGSVISTRNCSGRLSFRA